MSGKISLSRFSLLRSVAGLAALCLAFCGSAGCENSATSNGPLPASGGSKSTATTGSQPTATAGEQPAPRYDTPPQSGREALERMVAAYREATAYSDSGRIEFRLQIAGEPEEQHTPPFAVSFLRPNKLRLEVYETVLVSDGRRWRARIKHPGISNDVLDLEAPAKLTLEKIYEDEVLFQSLIGGLAGGALQPLLLLGDDPLAQILDGNPALELLEPENIGERACLRVAAHREDGDLVFWIDEREYLLRRLDFPRQGLKQALEQQVQATIESISLTAEFHDARFAPPEDGDAFRLELPAGSQLVERFNPRKIDNPPPPAPSALLGKQAPDFAFTTLDGEKVTRKSLAGKIVILDFWTTWDEPCRQGLSILQKAYEKCRDRDDVRFLAVSIDAEDVDDAKLRETLAELKVEVPIARGAADDVLRQFGGIPNLFVLGPDGVVQDHEARVNPALAEELPARLEKLAAGESLHEATLARHELRLADYERSIEAPPDEQSGDPDKIPLGEVAPRSEPAKLKITKLWSVAVGGAKSATGEDEASTEGEAPAEGEAAAAGADGTQLTEPGNLLVIDQGGSPLILVNDGWRAVAELDLQGHVRARHELNVPDDAIVASLRTALDGEGRRHYVGLASASRQLHVFDDVWQLQFSYPDEARSPVADALLTDLEADGQLEIYVGFWELVGVHRVGLDGRRAWGNKEVENVLRVAPATNDGEPAIACVNIASVGSSVAILSPDGKKLRDLPIQGRNLIRIESADLDGDGQLEYCGVDSPQPGYQTLVGLDVDGSELWTHPLATGIHRAPIEFVTTGKLLPGGQAHWLAAGPDGAILFIAANGEVVEGFHYGAAPTGLTTTEIDGHPVLLVATAQGVDAWQVGE